MSQLFQVKICGITNVLDAQSAINAGADAIGLNFYQSSPRSIDRGLAMTIPQVDSVARVGVFVNHSIQEIHRIVDTCSLDFVQLHGDESPEFAADLSDYRLIPVVRIRQSHRLDSVKSRIGKWLESDCQLAAILLDAAVGEDYGGTGHILDWDLAAKVVASAKIPIVLAGGLNPGNVATAIQKVRPASVDVASGVEKSPGKKSAVIMQSFVSNSLDAFGR